MVLAGRQGGKESRSGVRPLQFCKSPGCVHTWRCKKEIPETHDLCRRCAGGGKEPGGANLVCKQGKQQEVQGVQQAGGQGLEQAKVAPRQQTCLRVVAGLPVVWVKSFARDAARQYFDTELVAEEESTMAAGLLKDMGFLGVVVGQAYEIQATVLGCEQTLWVRAVEPMVPSMRLGKQAQGAWTAQGVKWEPEPRVRQPEEAEMTEDGVVFQGGDEMWADGYGLEDKEVAGVWHGIEELWQQRQQEAQEAAVEQGEHTGGLVTGGDWEYQGGLLGAVTPQLKEFLREAEQRGAEGLPSGPAYAKPEEVNPQQFRERRQQFVSGAVHLPEHAQKWIEIGADREVMEWIEHCYEIRVGDEGRGIRKRNGKTAQKNDADLQVLLRRLLEQKSWESIKAEEAINLIPFNLAPKPGAEPPWRLINNAMEMNKWVTSRWKVKYESLGTLAMVATPGCWGFTVDLKDGYYAMWIRDTCRALLAGQVVFSAEHAKVMREVGLIGEEVEWLADGRARVTMQPRGLVMGFTNSCAVFTKLTRQVAKYWRKQGTRLVHMMDDFAFFADTKRKAELLRDKVLRDLEELGFYVSWKKSLLEPSRVIKFLGFVVDLMQMRKFVPGEKIEELEALVRQLLDQAQEDKMPTIRRLLKVAGKVVSMGHGLLPARLMTRETYRIIRPENDDYDAEVKLTARVVEELVELLRVVRVWNPVGVPIRRDLRMVEVRVMMDAGSNAGWVIDGVKGDVVMVPGLGRGVGKDFTEEQVKMWQVQKELSAVAVFLKEEGQRLAGKRVLIKTDCVAVRDCIRKGMSGSDVLTDIMKEIWKLALEFGIALFAEWMPGTQMVVAGVDGLSRQHEGMLRPDLFASFDKHSEWGRRAGFTGYGMDLFASEKTRQGRHRGMQFCQRGGGGDSAGDARWVKLSAEVLYWVVPPLALEVFSAVLQRLQNEAVAATVVVPDWGGCAFHAWLMRYKVGEAWKLPWLSWPATFWDVSEGKVKPHVTVKWQFVAVNVDFRGGEKLQGGGVPRAVQQQQRRKRAAGPLRVLSLCDGMGGAALALQLLGVKAVVHAVEWKKGPRAVAAKWKGVSHGEHQDLEAQAWEGSRLEALLEKLGAVDMVVCGFPCQDVSPANQKGLGLEGEHTRLVYRCQQVYARCRARWPWVKMVFECSVSRMKHPKVMQELNSLLGQKALQIQAKDLCAALRKRQYWLNFAVGVPRHWEHSGPDTLREGVREAPRPKDVLDAGRQPAEKWKRVLPTIMAWGTSSYNMGEVVQDATGQLGPLRADEAERAMGMPTGATARGVDEKLVGERERFNMIGNSFAVPVMKHLLVSALKSLGMVTRNDVRQPGSPYTINYDGPVGWMVETPGGCWRECKVLQWRGQKCWVQTSQMAEEEYVEVARTRLYALDKALVGRRGKRAAMEASGPQERQGRARWRKVLQGEPWEMQEERPTAARVWAEGGVPETALVSREQGWQAKEWGVSGMPGGMTGGELASTLARDFVIMSRAPSTWKAYAAWWGVYEEYLRQFRVDWRRGLQVARMATLGEMRRVLEYSVGLLGVEYAFGTLEVYTAAVQKRFAMERWGNSQEDTAVKEILEGVKRWRGRTAEAKKMPVEAKHVAWLMSQGEAPAGWKVAGWKGWKLSVAHVVLGWLAGLRRSEIARLSACDMRWKPGGCAVAVNRTKNDQEGWKRTAELEFGLMEDLCPLRYVWEYAREWGKLQRRPGCTNESEPTLECKVCPRLFENLWNNGSVHNCEETKGLQKARSTTLVQALYKQLAAVGLADRADLKLYTAKSMRVGAVSAAAAAGVRRAVAAQHMRMRSVETLDRYDRVLPSERGVVSRVMRAQVQEGAQAVRRQT